MIVAADFLIVVKSGQWISDVIKYQELGEKAEELSTILDEKMGQRASIRFVVDISLKEKDRFLMLMAKGAKHTSFYARRQFTPDMIRLEVSNPFEDPDVKTTLTMSFIDVVEVNEVKGPVVMATLIRLANALAWALTYNVKLTTTYVKSSTWDDITIRLENPWCKDARNYEDIGDRDASDEESEA